MTEEITKGSNGNGSGNEKVFLGIEYGKKYPIHIIDEDTMTLQYVFKPSTIDNTKSGRLLIDDHKKTATVTFSDHNHDHDTTTEFTGTVSSAEDHSNERLLYFNGIDFTMTKISKEIHRLKYVRQENDGSKQVSNKFTNHMNKVSNVDGFRKRQMKDKTVPINSVNIIPTTSLQSSRKKMKPNKMIAEEKTPILSSHSLEVKEI